MAAQLALEPDLLFESAPDAMLLVDAAGTIVRANAATEALLGWRRDELLGQSVDVLVPRAVRAGHAVRRAEFAERPKRRAMGSGLDLRAVRKDGSEVSVEIGLSPLTMGGAPFVLASVRDVTERQAAERRAQISLERLVSALESFQDAFAIFDRHDRLVLCNSAYRSSLGPELGGAALGASYDTLLEQILAQAQPAGLEAVRARLRDYHEDPSGAVDLETRDGRTLRYLERMTPERGRIVTLHDLTDDVLREGELRDAREAAEAANSAKTEFLRSMSHELRTPLNAVLGFAQLLQRDRALTDRAKRHVEHVVKGGEHLLRLIDDVLDLARVESGVIPLSLEPVRIADLLEEVRSTLMPLADERGIALALSMADEGLTVRADRTRLRQIVLNFGSNAIKYGREAGRVTLRASSVGASGEPHIRVTVVDDGPGIPLERQARLFSAFYRAGQETGTIEGTGIGLALSRRLADMMGGEVGFTSEPGVGSEFWVALPLAPEPPRAPRVAPTETERSSSGPRQLVLYVEDNPANVVFMEELVASVPELELLTASTGELGLELARAHLPAVVLLDINLPGISGFEVLRRLKDDPVTAAIPVVALSASAMHHDVAQAEAAGFTRYLTKPVRVDRLLETLEALWTP